jgi:hypothetical protein
MAQSRSTSTPAIIFVVRKSLKTRRRQPFTEMNARIEQELLMRLGR